MKNKKIVNILIITIVALVVLSGCNGKGTAATSSGKATVNHVQSNANQTINQTLTQNTTQNTLVETKKLESKKAPLDALKDAFAANGFEVGENEPLDYSVVGATNGYRYKLNGQTFDVYVFEEGKLSDKGKKNLDLVKTGVIKINEMYAKVYYINGFVFTRLYTHKDKDKIIETVQNFKY